MDPDLRLSLLFCNKKQTCIKYRFPHGSILKDCGLIPMHRAFLVAQGVKNPSAMQETGVPSPGWEDPLQEEMATHSGIFARKTPWTEEPGRLQSIGLQIVGYD